MQIAVFSGATFSSAKLKNTAGLPPQTPHSAPANLDLPSINLQAINLQDKTKNSQSSLASLFGRLKYGLLAMIPVLGTPPAQAQTGPAQNAAPCHQQASQKPANPFAAYRVLGSAGLFGDPGISLYTPVLGVIPKELVNIPFTQAEEDPAISILKDPDGQLEVSVRSVEVNPQGNTGIGILKIKAGTDEIGFENSGVLTLNGKKLGNIKETGFILSQPLKNGGIVATSVQIDNEAGEKAERFTFENCEYRITAALRTPEGASAYLDINFEELTGDAADNATGHQETLTGLTHPKTEEPLKMGIADLLRLEPKDPILKALRKKTP